MAVNLDRQVRLSTWKEIAAFLGRDERTAKRWETTRALPVHRVPGGRSTVYADVCELEEWRKGVFDATRRTGPVTPLVASAAIDPVSASASAPASALRSHPRRPLWLILSAGIALGAIVFLIGRPAPETSPAAAPAPELYLQGIYAWNTRTRAGLTDAIADFSRVILTRPDYAPAYAGLADCYNLMPEYGGMSAADAYPQAKVAAERAVALDNRLAGAHRALGFVDFWWSHDVVGSGDEFARALVLDPNSAQSHHWYGNTLAMTGRAAAATVELDAALRLDPTSTAIRADRANTLFIAGRRREAINQLEAIVSARPDFAPAQRYLARMYVAVGDPTHAVVAMSAAARASGDPGERAIAAAARAGLARGGVAGLSAAIRAEREARYTAGGVSAYALAQSEAMIDPSRAVALLETSEAHGESAIMGIVNDPALASLRTDRRFRALAARLHLPLA